jgi:hypothetical protein
MPLVQIRLDRKNLLSNHTYEDAENPQLTLWLCEKCLGLCQPEDVDAHLQWHNALNDLVRRISYLESQA